ncbi:MAG: glycosyltransferase family 4 protein [Verrucomicrobia bacterium]|nr:glycosyltransferase family 4 protein [Verrucomicrobiota bacterium]
MPALLWKHDLNEKGFKIAVVVEELIVAGVSLCTVDLAQALAKIGYDVTLFVLRKPDYEVSRQERLSVVSFDTPVPLVQLSKLLADFDAIIVSNGVALPFGFEAARHTAKALIVEWLHGEVRARQCPAVDFTVAVSEPIFRNMQAAEHDLFIPNGVNLSKFYPAQRQSRPRVRLIQIAREWKTMGPDLGELGPELVREGLPVEAHIVGRNGPSSEHVTFHGVRSDVAPVLREADILLHLPEMETFGLPAIEAMASGVIPIVSNVGGLPSSVVHGVTGYVVGFGEKLAVRQLITELVRKINENHPDIGRIKANGLRRVRQHFDIIGTARRIGQRIQELALRLPRKHRSTAYPFSFIGPVLYYILGREDQYLTAMSDMLNAPDLTEALGNWKIFRSALGHEWKDVSPNTWKLLDAVYATVTKDASEAAFQRKAVCSFWLSFLALVLERYELLCDFLCAGDARKEALGGALPRRALATISFSLAVSLLDVLGVEIDSKLLEAKEHIQKCYYLNEFDRIAAWELGEDLLENVFRAANHPELLRSLRAMEANRAQPRSRGRA